MLTERRIQLGGRAELVITWDADGRAGGQVGTVGAAPYLDGLLAHLAHPPVPLLQRVGQIARRSYAANFAAGGRPAWAPLAPNTVRRKNGLLAAGRIPRRTPTGRIPRRLLQLDRSTGEAGFSGLTILIERGLLRDSWAVLGARGNVAVIDGRTAFFGSQLTVERPLRPAQVQQPYHGLTRKAQRLRSRGHTVGAQVPLARIHEEGAPRARIPARPVAVIHVSDLEAIQVAGVEWVFGK